MKEELGAIGFKPIMENSNWLEYNGAGFFIQFCVCEKSYFFIYTDGSGDRDAAPYPYVNMEKLKELIKAHKEYFT